MNKKFITLLASGLMLASFGAQADVFSDAAKSGKCYTISAGGQHLGFVEGSTDTTTYATTSSLFAKNTMKFRVDSVKTALGEALYSFKTVAADGTETDFKISVNGVEYKSVVLKRQDPSDPNSKAYFGVNVGGVVKYLKYLGAGTRPSVFNFVDESYSPELLSLTAVDDVAYPANTFYGDGFELSFKEIKDKKLVPYTVEENVLDGRKIQMVHEGTSGDDPVTVDEYYSDGFLMVEKGETFNKSKFLVVDTLAYSSQIADDGAYFAKQVKNVHTENGLTNHLLRVIIL